MVLFVEIKLFQYQLGVFGLGYERNWYDDGSVRSEEAFNVNNNAEVGFEEDVDRLVSKYLELLENQDVSLLRTRSAFTVYSSFIKQICLLVF